jgi:hypothetical protein
MRCYWEQIGIQGLSNSEIAVGSNRGERGKLRGLDSSFLEAEESPRPGSLLSAAAQLFYPKR